MSFAINIEDFDALSPMEQVNVVTSLWDRIAADPARVPISDAQRAELRRRVAEHDADPTTALAWEGLEAELLATR